MNKVKRIVITLVLMTLIGLVIYGIGWSSIRKSNVDLATERIDVDQVYGTLQEVSLLRQIVSDVEDDRATLESYFLKSDEIPLFLNTLEGFSSVTEERVTIASIEETNEGLLVELDAAGTFAQLYTLLALIENLPYRTEITQSFIIRTGEAEAEATEDGEEVLPWSLNMRFLITSYITEEES